MGESTAKLTAALFGGTTQHSVKISLATVQIYPQRGMQKYVQHGVLHGTGCKRHARASQGVKAGLQIILKLLSSGKMSAQINQLAIIERVLVPPHRSASAYCIQTCGCGYVADFNWRILSNANCDKNSTLGHFRVLLQSPKRLGVR